MSICADPEKELESFRSKYPIRDPQKPVKCYEAKPITTKDGLRELKCAPAKGIVQGFPPLCPCSRGCNTHLWEIDDDGVLFVEEKILESIHGRTKHSNLPYRQKAYIGGELWFETENQIYVSGGSGRYGPCSAEHLADAIKVFEAYGYAITSLGWDCDKGKAKRCLERLPEA